MGFDIRLPIGALFTVMGILLTIFGLVSDKSIYQRSLNLNVNLEWGLVLLVFGLLMYLFGRRADAAAAKKK
jgi:multisubunit Na+/H+ antiporter MnhG subunit